MSDLSNVQVGDLLINEFRGGANVVKVIRVTPTQVIVTNEQKYYKKTGRKVGGSGGFYFDSIHIPNIVDSIFVYLTRTHEGIAIVQRGR